MPPLRPVDVFLTELRDELSQGDILNLCPFGPLDAPIRVARAFRDKKTGKEASGPELQGMIYTPPLPPDLKHKPTPAIFEKVNDGPEWGLAEVRRRKCIVLSNDCVALAKAANQQVALALTQSQQEKPWHVAPIYPWPSVGELAGETGRPLGEFIEQGLVKRYLEVPEFSINGSAVIERSYIDLRLITPLKPALFEGLERLASMSDRGVALLMAKVFSFFSGKALPGNFRCRKCGADYTMEDFLAAYREEKAAESA